MDADDQFLHNAILDVLDAGDPEFAGSGETQWHFWQAFEPNDDTTELVSEGQANLNRVRFARIVIERFRELRFKP